LIATERPSGPPCLEFWFEFGSNYSYFSVMRIEELARRSGVAIAWKPFLLGPIFRDLGWSSSPFVLQPEKGRYVWRDMEREALKYGLQFRKPSEFPRVAVLPMRVALLGSGQPWMGAFCREVMRQNWVDDLDINDPGNVRRALTGLTPEPEAVMEEAQSAANKMRLRDQTAEARKRGIFGAPTFFFNDEMFWGNDRLEDAIAFAQAARPE
jgi:2-hydroxychromene-2-carboxylate isomerase